MAQTSTSMPRALAVMLAGSLAASLPVRAAPAEGGILQNPDAIEHFDRATAAFNRDDYEAAASELKAAYAIEPNPLVLYAWAQALRLSGDCDKAVPMYRRFLTMNPTDEERSLAETNLLDCGVPIEEPTPPPPDTTGDPTDPGETGTTPPTPQPDEPKPWYKDWLAPTLAGVGLGAVGGGAALVALGRGQNDDSGGAINEDASNAEHDEARRKNAAGWVLVGVGGALVVGGAIRYALLATSGKRSKKPKKAAVAPMVGEALGISLRIGF